MSIAVDLPTIAASWTACPTCWGQRRIFEDHNGEGLVPHTCPGCLGLGERILID